MSKEEEASRIVEIFKKTCTKCNSDKPTTEFCKNKSFKDGLRYTCKACDKARREAYRKTIPGVITQVCGQQWYNSKIRGHAMPSYTRQELTDCLTSSDTFNKLYWLWVSSGYDTRLKPSCDRLDDSKGYSFDNIRIVTWQENFEKANEDQRRGILSATIPLKPISQYTLEGVFVKSYISLHEAERQTGINPSNISKVARGKHKQSGGYKWKYDN